MVRDRKPDPDHSPKDVDPILVHQHLERVSPEMVMTEVRVAAEAEAGAEREAEVQVVMEGDHTENAAIVEVAARVVVVQRDVHKVPRSWWRN